MLSSFEIKNFRAFSHLRIERLARVNLIVGKNNVGKTTLLEALHVYAAENPKVFLENLTDHDELLLSGIPGDAYLDYRSLFHGRQRTDAKIVFNSVCGNGEESELTMELIDLERMEYSDGTSDFHEITNGDFEPEGEIVDGLVVRRDGGSGGVYRPRKPRRTSSVESRAVYVPTKQVSSGILGCWWDSIAGTAYEEEVIHSMRIVAPVDLVRLVDDPTRHPRRVFLVRSGSETDRVPLKSLGGGAFRMFQIATAIAYAACRWTPKQQFSEANSADSPTDTAARRTGFLLIDEIENGIHYTLHAELWKYIFGLAQKHNLQVFATSHSWDCMKGFQEALASDEEADGLVIRLENVEGEEQTGAVIVDAEDLPFVIRDSIEVR